MYANLKLLIFKLGIHQNFLAREVGIAESVLSRIIHGYREPSARERRALASCLGVDENWLFEKSDVRWRQMRTVEMQTRQGRNDGS